MRKVSSAFLGAILLACAVSCVSAQVVSCPEAHLSLTVPDSWTAVPLYDAGDPDLCLLLEDEDISLSVYVSDAGGLLPDAFEVFTGEETESGTVVFGGVEMTYVAGQSSDGNYRIYTWTDRRNQVQFWFLVTANRNASRKTIDRVMNSLEFE